MAKCDEGYLCEVCGQDVADLSDSALYLQYVIGWIDPETLHTRRESHLRCQPNLAQFIDDPQFDPPITIEGPFDRRKLDPNFAAVEDGEALLAALHTLPSDVCSLALA